MNHHIEKLLSRAVAFKDIWGDLYSTFLSFLPCQQEHTGEGSQIQPETQQAVCLPVHNVPTFERVANNLSADEWPWMRHLGAEGRTTLHSVKLWIHYSSKLGFQCATSWHLQLFSFCKWQTWHTNLLHGSKAMPRIYLASSIHPPLGLLLLLLF